MIYGCVGYKPVSITEVIQSSPPCIQQFLKEQGAVVQFTERNVSYTLPYDKKIFIARGQNLEFSVFDLRYETAHLYYTHSYCPRTHDPQCLRQFNDSNVSERFAYLMTKNQECP